MYRSSSSRIIPVILAVVVIVAVVAGLVAVGRYLFGGNGQQRQEEQEQVETVRDQLLTLAADRSVRVTVRGPIVGDDRFQTQRIAISPSSRIFTVYRGYLEDIDDQKSYDNNMQAYEEFVHALDKADMMRPGVVSPEDATDIRGICATGRIFEFEIIAASSIIDRRWTSTCKGSPGSFGASVDQVLDLFSAQIPERTFNFQRRLSL